MFDKLTELEIKFGTLSEEINDPAVIADQNQWRTLMKEHSDLAPIVESYREYKNTVQSIEEAKEMLEESDDEDMRQLAKEDLKENQDKLEEVTQTLKLRLLPKDPNDDKNVIVEIRGGAGGDEAALFASSLLRMYGYFAESHRWKTEVLSANENELGGFKEVVFMIQGRGAFSKFKYESGVHRVQRIPVTESGGRIHTSTVTVAVLPEAEDVDVQIDTNDVRVDVFRSSGNGGQSVNTTDSAVRLTHMPSGLVVSCQDEKSQLKNKDKAMKILRAKLYDLEQSKRQAELSAERRSQVGTGARNERIRTYNYPQSRVTDHRVSLTLHRLEAVLNGDLNEIVDTLVTADQAKKLSGE